MRVRGVFVPESCTRSSSSWWLAVYAGAGADPSDLKESVGVRPTLPMNMVMAVGTANDYAPPTVEGILNARPLADPVEVDEASRRRHSVVR